MKLWIWIAGFALYSSTVAAQLTPFTGAPQVAAGYYHSCAVDSAGGLSCWGDNQYGQLGDGTLLNRSHPVVAVGLDSGVAAVSIGSFHTCALKTDGSVWCWGYNSNGGLGDGTDIDRALPAPVTGLPGPIAALAAGDGHTCALTQANAMWCWGDNGRGQLGINSQTDSLVPVAVSGLGAVQLIGAGLRHSCAVSGGLVYCWGLRTSGQVGDGSTSSTPRLLPNAVPGLSGVTALALGGAHSCALSGGAVSCWGENSSGQVGDGSNFDQSTPQAVIGGTGMQAVFAGVATSCSIDAGGALFCWGSNGTGALGDGTFTDRNTPVAVLGLGSGVTQAAPSIDHTCAVRNGEVQCWGDNLSGQIAADPEDARRALPATVSGSSGVGQLDVGTHASCLIAAGALRCWGRNPGDGSGQVRFAPVPVTGLGSGVQAVSVGGGVSCAVANGGVQCWGSNLYGALGNGGGADQPAPVPVTTLGSGMSAVAVGDVFACALSGGGAVSCWGYNNFGQLGNGSQLDQSTPVPVTGLGSGVASIAAGHYHACAVGTDNSLKCWGFNGNGQLGDGSTSLSTTPVTVTALGNTVQAVTTGDEDTCALSISGAVSCWGAGFGPLPVAIPQLASGVQAISAGESHRCALRTDGNVLCWGSNSFGQLGDATFDARSEPRLVLNLYGNAVGISAGFRHTCAALSDGSAKCWGTNQFGQLGVGGRVFYLAAAALLDITERRIVAAVPAANGDAIAPSSSASGRYLAFQSAATDLGLDDNEPQNDIYRVDTECDAVTGLDASGTACERITRASVDDAGAAITGEAVEPSLSGDGQFVVFVAEDAGVNKVRGESAKAGSARRKGGGWGVYMRSLIGNGATFRMGNSPGIGTTPQLAPGAGVAVITQPNPSAGKPDQTDVYVVPRPTIAAPNPTPVCISCKTFDGNGRPTPTDADGASSNAVVSADGQWVAWQTQAKNLLPTPLPCTDPNQQPVTVMLRNLVSGATQRMGAPPSAQDCANSGSRAPKIDYSGGKVVFQSNQPLTPGASGNNVYLFDLLRGATQRMSVPPAGGNANPNGASTQPTISGDGQTVVFVTTATDLDDNEFDSNGVEDLVIYSVKESFAKRLARTARGGEANRASRRPSLNYMGNRIAFDSAAGNLTAESVLDRANVYERLSPINLDRIFTGGFD